MTTEAVRPATFDPTEVPIYPVLTIELGDAGPSLNGRLVPVPAGLLAEQAAVAAVAREVHAMPGVQAVRVHARTAAGHRYRIVVDADGQVWELPVKDPARPRPPWLWPAVAACTAVVLCGGTAAAALATRSAPTAAQAPLPTAAPRIGGPVGAGANLPRTPPPGYAARATWSVALDARVAPLVTSDGTIVAVDDDGDLVRLDPATGNVTWSGSLPSGSSGLTLHLSTLAGEPVVATALGRTLYTWKLPTRRDLPVAAGQAPDRPQATTLPKEGTVTWDGASPLVTLPDQTAAVVTGSSTQQLDIPIGATALTADDHDVVAADTAGHWWHLSPGEQAAAPLAMTPPSSATDAAPLRVVPAGSAHLAAVWATPASQTVVLYDAVTGAAVAQVDIDQVDLSRAAIVRQTEGPRLTLGPVLIDPAAGTVVYLGPGVTPSAISDGHVYASSTGNRWLDITLAAGTATTREIVTNDPPALPRGIVTGPPNMALVVADKVNRRLLYGLPVS